MRIGVDLLWVRPGKNGGTESYIRNLLDGFQECVSSQIFVLFMSTSNAGSFQHYGTDRFEKVICPVNTSNFVRRVIWENIYLPKYTRNEKIDVWFFPVYSKPFFMGKVPTVTVIHDLQAMHYPEYFSRLRNRYFRVAWFMACLKSTTVIAISEFCKKDIINNFKINPSKIKVIYNPIGFNGKAMDFEIIGKKYGIESGQYYYTVCSLAKHKNLITILKAMKALRDNGNASKLVISGVKVNAEGEVFHYIKKNHMNDVIVYTGFVSDEERNALYKNCKLFLFPSVFEGFGMPPVEAMVNGVPVLTTKKTSLLEITDGKAMYVENPYDSDEWSRKMMDTYEKPQITDIDHFKKKYDISLIAEEYCRLLSDVGAYRID